MLHHEDFEYEGLDALEDRLLQLDDEATYVVLFDRTDRQAEQTIGRLDLDAESVEPWLEGSWSTPAALRAACSWLRDTAARHTVGDAMRRFRVRIYGPKGLKTLDGGSFVCRNLNHDPGFDLELPAPAELAEVDGVAHGMAALGRYYAEFGRLLLSSTVRLQAMSDRTLARMGRQLDESRGQVDTLVAATLEYRFREVEAAEVRVSERKDTDGRNQLVRETVGQLADAVKTLGAMSVSAPELEPVMAIVRERPEVLDLLKSDAVRSLLADPAQLQALLAALAPRPSGGG